MRAARSVVAGRAGRRRRLIALRQHHGPGHHVLERAPRSAPRVDLEMIAGGAALHHLVDDARILERRDDDDGQLGIAGAQLDDAFEPARSRHRQVEQHKVDGARLVEHGARRVDRRRLRHLGIGERSLDDQLQGLDE